MTYYIEDDRTVIIFADDTYRIRMTKIVRATDHPVEFIYARLDMNVVPEDSALSARYYSDNPISLEALNFRCFRDQRYGLRYNVMAQYPSNIELAILMHRSDSGLPEPIAPGQSAVISYEFEAGIRQWGPWLERAIRMPTGRVSACLAFPRKLIDCGAATLVGGNIRPLGDALRTRRIGAWDIWSWSRKKPLVHERFRFAWTFHDGRERRLRSEIERRYGPAAGEPFTICGEGRSITWFGTELYFSTMQAQAIISLLDAKRCNRPKLQEQALLEEIDSRSTRLRDVFRNHPAWGNLVQTRRGFAWLDNSRESYDAFLAESSDA